MAIGGMGEVWRGWDETMCRPVAVKLLRARYSRDPRAVAGLRAEARCAKQIRHRGIVQIYDFGELDAPFLVMELLEGQSLAGVLARGPLAVRQALDVITQAAWALDGAHRAGILHLDIKPANLLMESAGWVKLIDFGIARMAGDGAAPSEPVLGTAAYLAPERTSGQLATVASDLYSLGIVLYECIAGERPFTGTVMEIALAHQMRELPRLPGTVPAGVVGLLRDLTSKDPDGRPSSAVEVATRAGLMRDQLPEVSARLRSRSARAYDRCTAAAATIMDFPAIGRVPPAKLASC